MSAPVLGRAGSRLGAELTRTPSRGAAGGSQTAQRPKGRCLLSPKSCFKSRSAESTGGCSLASACRRERGSSRRALPAAGFSSLCPGDPAARPGASTSTKAFSFSSAHATRLLLTSPAQRQGRCAGRLTGYQLRVTKKAPPTCFSQPGWSQECHALPGQSQAEHQPLPPW